MPYYVNLWLDVLHHGLQRLEQRVLTLPETFGGTEGVHLGTELRGVDLVAEEVIVLLPLAIAVKLCTAALVQVNEGNTLHGCDIGCPLRLWLADNLTCILIAGITGGERHKNGVGTFLSDVVDILPQIGAVAINSVMLLCTLVEADNHRVGVYAGDDTTGSSGIKEVGSIVVAYRDNDPVAGFQCLMNSGPEVGVEGSGGHTAERLVLNGNLAFVEVFVGEISPAPLSVRSVALRAVAHGRVADEEEHGIGAFARAAGLRA